MLPSLILYVNLQAKLPSETASLCTALIRPSLAPNCLQIEAQTLNHVDKGLADVACVDPASLISHNIPPPTATLRLSLST